MSIRNGRFKDAATVVDLEVLLEEIDLGIYFAPLQNQLKIFQVDHLRDVDEGDLAEIGMSKPEQRRLMKCFHKYFPDSRFNKLKKKVLARKHLPNRPQPSSNGSSLNQNSDMSNGLNGMALEDQHIISTQAITLCKILGEGEFGQVHQAVWKRRDGSKNQVAVKRIEEGKLKANTLDFLHEAAILHKVTHNSIVRLYGVCFDLETKSVMLVSELAPLRSLDECLKKAAFRTSFPVMTLCDYAQQICAGMVYLEQNQIIHRDLAARNILVFSTEKVTAIHRIMVLARSSTHVTRTGGGAVKRSVHLTYPVLVGDSGCGYPGSKGS